MTATIARPGRAAQPAEGPDLRSPDNVAPLVVWLGSTGSKAVTGQVFEVGGGRISVAEGWRRGPTAESGTGWVAAELGPLVEPLVAQAYQVPVPGAAPPGHAN
jgi:hypothetical protein